MKNVIVTIAVLLVTAWAGMAQTDSSYLTVKSATHQKYGLDPSKELTVRVTQTPEEVLKKIPGSRHVAHRTCING